MHALVAFATPFRMPDFFMIPAVPVAGHRPQLARLPRTRRSSTFGYFYLLCLPSSSRSGAGSLPPTAAASAGVPQLYLVSLIDPFGTIWFIYLLPIFSWCVKATRQAPWWIIWLIGAALEMAHVQRAGW